VIPSRVLADGRTEGTPVVCLEALAAGCAVVAANAGGLAEVIVDGQNGLLFEAADHRMLRKKLTRALDDQSLRQTLSANARCSAAAYDWSVIGPRFSAIMTSSLNMYGQPRSERIEPGNVCG
jgi:glycosyltransferase involved in cell wall biosynthesis